MKKGILLFALFFLFPSKELSNDTVQITETEPKATVTIVEDEIEIEYIPSSEEI